jgi:hypothetical protein
MTIKMPGVPLPSGATVDIHVHVTAPVNITPFVAQQKVTSFVVREISDRMRGELPELVVGDRLCWSVPVVLTSPSRGVVGTVGNVLVDAATGELLLDPDTVQRMTDDADRLAERSVLPPSERELASTGVSGNARAEEL